MIGHFANIVKAPAEILISGNGLMPLHSIAARHKRRVVVIIFDKRRMEKRQIHEAAQGG